MKKIISPILLLLISSIAIAEEKSVILNFQNADLHTIIEVIAKETEKNFLIDPRVRKQKITLIAESAVNPEDAYSMFLSILRIYGYGAIESDNLVKILPSNDIKQSELKLSKKINNGKGIDDVISVVIPLEKSKAEQMAGIIRPLIPSFGQIIAHGDSNSLLILAPVGVINKVKDIIDSLEGRIERALHIEPLKHSTAAEIVAIVNKLEKKAIAKTNGLLIIEDKSSNQIIISGGTISDRKRAISYIRQLDNAKKNKGDTQVIYLNYAKAKDLVGVLKDLIGKTEKDKKGTKISITADENTNSLLVFAPGKTMQKIKNAIVQLDIRKAQVLVQAIIVEVSDNNLAELGVRWAANTGAAVGLIDFSGAGSLINLLGAGDGNLNPGALGSGSSLAIGNFSGNSGWGALLKALRANADTNILSTPSVVTLDNEEAELFVGQEVPVLTGQTLRDDGNPFTSYERKQVGLTLKVTPQINRGDAMQLDIEQKVENVQTSSGGVIGASFFNERKIDTSVIISDKEILVLGGLTTQQTENNTEKVSGLGDIPFIGGLFKSRRNSAEKRTLMVFIKTNIIRNFRDSHEISSEKYSALYEKINSRPPLELIDKDNFIVLPEEESMQNNIPKVQVPATKSVKASVSALTKIPAKNTPNKTNTTVANLNGNSVGLVNSEADEFGDDGYED